MDKKTELYGYKDLTGKIKIPAKFNYASAQTFYNIIAVQEDGKNHSQFYYLLKNGTKVGLDSVYTSDWHFECESEGKIVFRAPKTDRVGFFDKNGKIIIPAMYNYATPFHNNLSIAHINAKRKCYSGEKDTLNCEHWGWEGGKNMLINEKNEILVDSFKIDYNQSINWYSMKVNSLQSDTSNTVSFKGEKGNIYSFTDYAKEFKNWFFSAFIPILKSNNAEKIKNTYFSTITYWSEKESEWKIVTKEVFLKKYPVPALLKRFQHIDKNFANFAVSQESLNPYIYAAEQYKLFYNSCGEHKAEKYPLFDVVITSEHENKDLDYQEHLEFIRTANGYKLLEVSLK